MQGNLYFYSYKNYYNREAKKFNTLEEYAPFFVSFVPQIEFNPNDGIETIIESVQLDNTNVDYCIFELYGKIVSRWFVMEAKRDLGGYYTITLRRDVIADNWEKLLTAPAYIEKATVNDQDVLIYNDENISFNQIKRQELLLKDETKCAWIVGYLSRSYLSEEGAEAKVFDAPVTTIPDYIESSIEDFVNNVMGGVSQNETKKINTNKVFRIPVTIRPYSNISVQKDICYDVNKNQIFLTSRISTLGNSNIVLKEFGLQERLNAIDKTKFFTQGTSYITDATAYEDYYDITGKNHKIPEIGGSFYKVNYTQKSDAKSSYVDNVSLLITYLNQHLSSVTLSGSITSIQADYYNNTLSYDLINVTGTSATITIPTYDNRIHLKDAPYDMFCIPYGDNIQISNSNDTLPVASFSVLKSTAMNIAQAIAEELTQSNIYDIQLLPYCPMSGFNIDTEEGVTTIDLNTDAEARYNLVTVTDSEENIGVVIWSASSSGTKDIDVSLTLDNIKIDAQTKLHRFCSPNYNGQFEINLAKNGDIDKVNVDYTYLPYQPYIHVTPIFSENGLYGGDYNDARGLTCNGDFSISYLSDAWKNYQVQNKNYNNVFLRTIQNMDVNHQYSMTQQAISSATSALLTGSVAGSSFGKTGGLIAGGLSLAGGIADMAMAENLYKEQKSYTTDIHNYQLDNIKALPDSIAKVTAYTENNKIFPLIEIYDCTEREKEIFANKIRYDGMNVHVIGTIADYIYNSWSYGTITDKGFIKGQFIQLTDVFTDTHEVQIINEEFSKGVYTK